MESQSFVVLGKGRTFCVNARVTCHYLEIVQIQTLVIKQTTIIMKKTLMTIIILWTVPVYGQSFEGTLSYISDFELAENMKKMGMTKEMLHDKMKQDGSYSDTIKISYKQGNYYILTNNNPKSWSIYKAETNKIYTMQDGDAADICTVTDASIDLQFTMTSKMPTIEKLDTTVIVGGVSCSIVRVKWKSGTYDYYYDPTKLTVDPALFSKHVYDGWADFLKISKALPVKIVKTTKGMMTVTMTLVTTKTEVIDEKLFSIPKLVPDKDLNLIKIANREVMRVKK
ncbi:MAG: hypothetical protein J0M05_01890 [Candidatus Kapabacteria bacterium]|nr:hypothetical protein [Candidatus Kapabacteria bacterium]